MFNQLDTHWKKDLLIHDSQDKALLIAKTAFSKKARNIVVLKLAIFLSYVLLTAHRK